MIKEIKYSGYTATPSDYECHDGDLDIALNFTTDDGSLHPSLPPLQIAKVPDGQHILGIHTLHSEKKNFISWRHSADQPDKFEILSCQYPDTATACIIATIPFKPQSMAILGNTLAIATDSKVLFSLWKDNRYIYLGSAPEFINIEFALSLRGCLGTGWHKLSFATNPFGYGRESEGIGSSSKENPRHIEGEARRNDSDNAIMAHFNLSVHDQVTSNGYFYQPFFIRYAFRLFDGSYAWLSSPVLMLPAVAPPFFEVDGYDSSNRNYFQDISVHGHSIPFFQLFYRVLPFSKEAIDAWSDIISGIDFFVSPPIYTFKNPDSDNHCSLLTGAESVFSSLFKEKAVDTLSPIIKNPSDNDDTFQSGRQPSRGDVNGKYFFGHFSGDFRLFTDLNSSLGNYRPGTITGSTDYTVKDHYVTSDQLNAKNVIALPCNDKFLEDITHVSQFYKIASWDIADISSTDVFNALIVDTADLSNLLTRPTLPDDATSTDSFCTRFITVYNQRLHLSNVRFSPPKALHPRTLVQYSNPSFGNDLSKIIKIEVWTRRSGSVVRSVLSAPQNTTSVLDSFSIDSLLTQFPRWIYYPDSNAFAMRITAKCRQTSQAANETTVEFKTRTFNLPLRSHELLNGAYYFGGIAVSITPDESEALPAAAIDNAPDNIEVPSSVYVSEINNPFLFPFKYAISVGSGTVLSLASAAKALSQGQFGQFPLYAFTTEGVWALEVSATGTYSARQPITRDVCISPEGITQLDSSVLFPTVRGIMLLSGSTSTCISDTINTDHPFSVTDSLPSAHTILNIAGLPHNAVHILPFATFLAHSRMLYDYPRQRIILYRPSTHYAYIYSLRSKLWTMITADITQSINSYPNALAIDSAGTILDYSDHHTDTRPPAAILITRPLKLSAPVILKTIDTLIQRGQFQKGNLRSILYGSRDLINWHLVNSSISHRILNRRGTPYKYFRIALIATLDPSESISGCTIQYTPRLTNQPR
ncbi:hypothetical protein [Muribaculum intestinale]|uniref:hypothetical protein n=1 Tax=Muribaculum intestinale TaxID=1796646 RepID=UPI0025A610FD|nr:hypothetical protein [Muribaculum intestinale]